MRAALAGSGGGPYLGVALSSMKHIGEPSIMRSPSTAGLVRAIVKRWRLGLMTSRQRLHVILK